MSRVYKYNIDSKTCYLTALHFILIIGLGATLYLLYEGGIISAWFASCVVAFLLLMSLSIPRYIEVTSDRLMINCLLDVTEIEIEQIVSVRKVSPRKIRHTIPIFGGRGFFGYYGHYFDLKCFRRFVIYASEWQYLVEIVDIYEDVYYISCRRRDELIAELHIKMPYTTE